MTAITTGTDHEARHHAARASLCWTLGELLDAELRPVDLETLRAMLEVIEPPSDLSSPWREIRDAIALACEEDLTGGLRSAAWRACARDLRALARWMDRASMAALEGDLPSASHARARQVELLRDGAAERLGAVAETLERHGDPVTAPIGRVIGWVLRDTDRPPASAAAA